jgi:O-antigen ligase
MTSYSSKVRGLSPPIGVYAAFAAVQLALWIPYLPTWYTFLYGWRVEIGASVLLGSILTYLFIRSESVAAAFTISKKEFLLVVCPMLALILWSAASALWAHSWKSTVHHASVWSIYLIFYLLVRNVVATRREFEKILATVTITLVLVSIPAVAEYCAYLVFGGSTSLGIRFAKWGEQIVTILPLLLVCLVRLEGRRFWIGLTATALLWLLIFCSLGRINLFLFAFGVVAVGIAIAINKAYRRYFRKFILIAFVLALSPLPLHVFSYFADNPEVPLVARLSNSAALSSSNNFRKLMVSLAGEMIVDNSILGVGADNFWIELNKYRAVYGTANPNDANLAAAEDEVPGFAHNEFLQMVAELGIVGGAIAAFMLAGVAVMLLKALGGLRSGSLLPYAAAVGLLAFIISSMVSSYSFRVMQNGIVFFFILAVASKTFFRKSSNRFTLSPTNLRAACGAGILACCVLAAYSAVRLSSVFFVEKADAVVDIDEASEMYKLAASVDDENPAARYRHGMRLFEKERYAEAIPLLRETIAVGHARSSDFSYMATAQSLSGDDAGAEDTMAIAVSLYPRSPFVWTRYSLILAQNGKTDLAGLAFEKAIAIDRTAANSWKAVIEKGPKAASDLAARDSDYVHVMQLTPSSSMYAVVAERLIRHPEERKFSAHGF